MLYKVCFCYGIGFVGEVPTTELFAKFHGFALEKRQKVAGKVFFILFFR